jgi:cytochrome c
MSFAGLSRQEDRINLIAFLRTNAAAPAPIPAPKPVAAEPAKPDAAAPANDNAKAPAGEKTAPADAGAKSNAH